MSELKPRITENGIDYILVGDYYIPDLKLPKEHRPIGKYGRMHREYLREVHPVRLNTTGGSDILAKTGVKISESTFTNNTSTNAGGAVTLWQDGSKDSTALAHSISGSTFSGKLRKSRWRGCSPESDGL